MNTRFYSQFFVSILCFDFTANESTPRCIHFYARYTMPYGDMLSGAQSQGLFLLDRLPLSIPFRGYKIHLKLARHLQALFLWHENYH